MGTQFLFQLLVNGLCVGLCYGLAAVGLALLFGILGQINFAHGEIYMIGAFALWLIMEKTGLPYAVAGALVVVLMGVLGLVLSQVVLLPVQNKPFEAGILATFALSIILQNVVRLTLGATPQRIPTPLQDIVFDLEGVLVFGQRAFASFIALVALFGLGAFLRFTSAGRTMRAMAQSREACAMVGIDTGKVTRLSAVISTALCGLSAVAIAPLFDLFPNMGTDVSFRSFAVIIIGGMGNIGGVILAGLLLGISESFVGGLVGMTMRDGIGFILMIAMLLLRPHGLFGKSVRI